MRISAAPAGPWAEILREHLNALRGLLGRVGEAARVNEQALRTLPLPGRPGPAGAAGLLDQLAAAGNVDRSVAVIRRASQPLLAQYVGWEQG